MSTQEKRLIEFARRTLAILESNQDWNADTSEAICNAAIAVDVAGFEDGFFRAQKEGVN